MTRPEDRTDRERDQEKTGSLPRVRRAYEAPRLLGVESLEVIAAACAPTNPGGPGKAFPTLCATPGS